jgi:hypothetical protein
MMLNNVVREIGARVIGLLQTLRFRFGRANDGTPLKKLPYVFIVGFNKAGTRSLTEFFRLHGVPSVHWDYNKLVLRMLKNIESGERILKGYDSRFLTYSDFTLADDTRLIEGNQFFERLYRDYPGSLFILNTRPIRNWINSRILHRNGLFLSRQLKILGTRNQSIAIEKWGTQRNSHEASVRAFFSDKPKQFIEIDIETDNVGALLANFLPMNIDESHWRHVGKSNMETDGRMKKCP